MCISCSCSEFGSNYPLSSSKCGAKMDEIIKIQDRQHRGSNQLFSGQLQTNWLSAQKMKKKCSFRQWDSLGDFEHCE